MSEPDPQTVPEAAEYAGSQDSPAQGPGDSPADPTRYGDWERNGRCIDF